MNLFAGDATRRERLALFFFAVGLVASLFVLVHPWFDVTNDGSMYVLTSCALLDGEGFTYNGVPFQIRPPGFSLLIAPVLAAFGTSFLALNLWVSLFGALGVVLLYAYARPRLGWPVALLTAAVVWLAPAYRTLCTQVMSDVPGVALLFLCLLVERWSDRAPSVRRELALGLVVGLSFYVRTFLVLLVPAVVLARLLRAFGRPRDGETPAQLAKRLSVLVGVAVASVLPWAVRLGVNPAPAPAEQTKHYSYATATWHADTGDPASPRLGVGDVLARVPEQGGEVLQHLGGRLHAAGSGVGGTAIALVLLGSTVFVLVRRRESAELFALANVAVLSVTLHFLPRHVLPVFLVALVNAVEVVQIAGRRFHPRVGSAAAALVLVALLAWDFDLRPRWGDVEESHRFYADLAADVGSRIEDDAKLGSPYGFVYAVYLDRPVYNLGFAVERSGVVNTVEALIDNHGLNTVVLSPAVPRDRPFVEYFAVKYGAEPVDGVCVARVRP